ncbi:restriction endonuclease subunit S [Mycolicibacterium fallax]|uniref:restriction endonuclease subunit S n=1 Tax=Mycolicibacterium fallax TaxID=1793 RepID=UPI000A15605A|nr:restriction endonuclease subunit S [Mycolicibacterium fallax]BBY96923.1 hypothetical protein MFAL_03900 [Mycolicibacterium fallax]
MGDYTLGELSDNGPLEMSDGYRTKRSELGQPGFRILRVADVGDWCVSTSGDDFVRKEFRRQIGSKLSAPGDVLLSTKGTIGRVALFPELAEQVVYSPQLCFFRVLDPEVIDARYLAYWLKSPEFLRQASYRSNSSDMAPYISLRDLRSVSVNLPDVYTQRAIAGALGALDGKIAANERVSRDADELAGSLWTRSVVDGRSLPLSELAQFVNGRPFTKSASGTGRVVVRIAELNSGIGPSTVRNDIEVADEYVVRPGDLLFAWSGSLTVARWFRPEGIVNQHIFKVIPKSGFPIWLLNQAIRSKLAEFKAIASDKATTMGHIQRRHLDEPVKIPTTGSIETLDPAMGALWSAALAAEIENLKLARTRDELLPLLMSGRLRVKDAEAIASDVL